ncbi:MAG: hypothetical protein ACJASL_001113 [Paraglaciecola sp.]|jgi:hypothetical protein
MFLIECSVESFEISITNLSFDTDSYRFRLIIFIKIKWIGWGLCAT